MAELSARAVAKRLNRSEKTIRRWIHSGRLRAVYRGRNLFGIEEEEVETMRKQGHAKKSDLERRMDRAEQEIRELREQLVVTDTSTRSLPRTGTKNHDKPARSPRATDESLLTEADLPAGARRASEFAESHGVMAKTFRYHLLTGLAGERVNHLAIRKPGRPGEIERWLSPDQQQMALAFWERHHVTRGI